MTVLPSPYTPGETATFTPGRELEQARQERLLVEAAGESAFQGRIQVLQGARGVGKTSLLRAIERRAEALGLTTVFVTATPDEGIGLVAAGLAHALTELQPASVTDRFRSAVTSLGAKLGPVEATVALERTTPPDSAVASLKEVVGTVARSTARARRGLAVFVDEVQDMPRADIRTLATAWQELDASVKKDGAEQLPAVLLTAGLSNAQEVITRGASFGERFRFTTLGNLERDAAKQAVVEPAILRGVKWDQGAVEKILDASAGYPYFLQVYADETWEAARPRRGDTISIEDTTEGVRAAQAQIDTFYRGRWNRATAAEQRILAVIAASGKDSLARSAIAEQLGLKPSDIGMARASLLGKGLLTAPRRGVLAFATPGFGRFIVDELEG